MDNKTKEAIKQIQGELRQMQSLLAQQRPDVVPEESDPSTANAKKPKADSVLEFEIDYPDADGSRFQSGHIGLSAGQLARVTDEAVAELGYALSSPQKVGLLRALLATPSESAGALGTATHLTTGSLYHHLRDLMHAGLVSQTARNRYLLAPRGKRVLLMLLALASDR